MSEMTVLYLRIHYVIEDLFLVCLVDMPRTGQSRMETNWFEELTEVQKKSNLKLS